MRVTLRRSWFCKPSVLMIVAVIGLCAPSESSAEVKDVTLKDLAAQSKLIVIATVLKVEAGPPHLERLDPGAPPLKVATAKVIETLKGAAIREVRYVASPSWMCDTSSAEPGEQVVLFLEDRKDSAIMSIVHAGRGRMVLHKVKEKTYAELEFNVILPKGTPTISEARTARLTLERSEPGKPAPKPLEFTYSVTHIELGVLRGLVAPKA